MKLPAPGLYGRIAWSLSILLTLAMLALGYVVLRDAQKQFQAERMKLLAASARTLAEGSLDALASGDYELLEYWVRSILLTEEYAYAFLSRANGQILTHSDLEQVAHTGDALGELEMPMERQKTYKGRPVVEVVYPARLGKRHLANVHVAYFLDEDGFVDSFHFSKLAGVIAVSLAVMLVAMLLIVRHSTRPLAQLTQSVTTLSLPEVHREIDSHILNRSDEIGALARAFDSLSLRLIHAFNELKREERRLQDTVDLRTRDLAESNRELEAFCYSVSHDLRAPLRAIDGFSRALAESCGDELDGESLDFLERIINSVQRMSQLIDDLLRLSQISRQQLIIQEVDLAELANSVFADLREAEPMRKVKVVVDGELCACGDHKLLGIALANLLGNAWKYTSRTPEAIIEFGVEEHDGEKVFVVRDNGAGFEMEYASDLFAPFKRMHREDEFPGNGVGLATVERIIRRHGGSIWFRAAPGKGASFYFTLGSVLASAQVDIA